MVGYYAYNYYVKKSGLKNLLTAAPYYDVISINYENDIKFIYKNLKSKFGNNLKIKEFYIFSQFLGKSTKFYLNNELILNVFDHNFRCTVYITSKNKKLKIASFSTMIMMILASIFYNIVFENKVEKNNQTLVLSNLIAARNFYLKKRNLTVMDVSPFKEFGYECIGETMEFQRLQFLEREKRKKSNKKIVFRYEPTGKKTKSPNFIFNNSSGNQIKRKKDLIINIF